MESALDQLIQDGSNGNTVALAADCLMEVEDRRLERDAAHLERLDELFRMSLDSSWVLGITGPPGAGKSTLLSRLIATSVEEDCPPGVVAIDPSSKRSGGSLLGDEVRIGLELPRDQFFFRSVANRGLVGGVSDRTFASVTVLRALFKRVFVETVGVGQSETDIAGMVDTTMIAFQPASGDTLQCLKDGIMEVPDVIVVTKGDLGTPATRALADLEGTMHAMRSKDGWMPKPVLCSAEKRTGLDDLWAELRRHQEGLEKSSLAELRRHQAVDWIWSSLVTLYGQRGALAIVGPVERELPSRKIQRCKAIIQSMLQDCAGPFTALEKLGKQLDR